MAKGKNRIVYVHQGAIERGTGKPGYRWVKAYGEKTADGKILHPLMSRRECQTEARGRDCVATFVEAK